MKCPKCRRYLEDGSESHTVCGWNVHQEAQIGYQRCEWKADTQCSYPGSMSTNLKEGGPYFCRLHFACRDPVWGSQIVEASKDYRHVIPGSPEDLARAMEKALDSLEAQGMGRQPNESFKAYRLRTMRFVRDLSGINKAA